MHLKVGDIVRLRSGGPDMTVGDVNASHGPRDCEVSCRWFKIDGTYEGAVFREGTIVVVLSIDEPHEFGLPEALQKAKDDEAQRLQDEADAKWADDQVRYAHTEGTVDERAE